MANWSFATRLPDGPVSSASDSLSPGDRFGVYELVAELGAGGSGRVFRARGPSGDEVALKVLSGTLDGSRRERFQREGQLVASLSHAGIVRLIDGGEVGGVPFLVYELVDGGAGFSQRLDLASLRGRVSMIASAAAALGYAHARGVVHRDLKPANLLVDDDGGVRVADFGLALGGGIEARLTQTGEIVGTPLYMAPEQTTPGVPVGPPADVWALGVILYEAITGERPFAASGWLELRRRIQDARPAPPRALHPQLSPALEEVVLRSLDGNPAQRYPNGLALARALEALIAAGHVPNTEGPPLRVPSARVETDSGPFPLGPLGRFELREVLGRGAMGVVYRALDPDLGREVALKFVLSARGTKRMARFQREGEITASLRHPNILRVHNTGALDGIPYLVYELVPRAQTLADAWIDADLRARVGMLRDAARGIGQAHAQGVVHRDLKPENVLVDQDQRVLVADFGLAAMQGLEKLTRTGAVVGTPNYMAPELIAGDREQVGPHTDVWALGIMLFECLTDELPFTASTMVELSVAITSGDVPPPRREDRPPQPELEAVCRMALQRQPRDRYPDGAAFAEDLEAWLTGRRVSASTVSSFAPLMRRGGKWTLLLVPLLASLVIAGLALSAHDPPSPPPILPPPEDDPSPTIEQPSEVWLAEGRRTWRDVKTESEGSQQLAAARRWLELWSKHPLADEAAALIERLRLSVSVATLEHGRYGDVFVAFQGSDRLVATGEDGTITRWDVLARRQLLRLELPARKHPKLGKVVALDAERAVVCGATSLWWIDFARGEQREVEGVHAEALTLSADRGLLAVGTSARIGKPRVIVFDTASREQVAELEGFRAPLTAITWLPSGIFAFAGAKNAIGLPSECSLTVWDGANPEPTFRIPLRTLVRCADWSQGGELLVVGTLTGEVLILDPSSGEERGEFIGRKGGDPDEVRTSTAHHGTVKGVVFSPSGRLLYSVSQGSTGNRNQLRVWDVATRLEARPLATTPGRRNESMAISEDGRLLAVGAKQGKVELWEAE